MEADLKNISKLLDRIEFISQDIQNLKNLSENMAEIPKATREIKRTAESFKAFTSVKSMAIFMLIPMIAGLVIAFYIVFTYMQPSAETIAAAKIKKEQEAEVKLLKKYNITNVREFERDGKKWIAFEFSGFKEVLLPDGELAKHSKGRPSEYRLIAVDK